MMCNTEMEKYEARRAALKALVEKLGRGGIARIAKLIGKEPNYVSRMLYPPEKKGMKRIGEDSVEALDTAFPGWQTPNKVEITSYLKESDKTYSSAKEATDANVLAQRIIDLSLAKSLRPSAIKVISDLVDQLSGDSLTTAPHDTEGLDENAVDKLTAKANKIVKTTRQN